jgi:hypothetical protein
MGHIRQPGRDGVQEKKFSLPCSPRGVERTHSWPNRFWKLLVGFKKTTAAYQGLLELAGALIAFRQMIVIYG